MGGPVPPCVKGGPARGKGVVAGGPGPGKWTKTTPGPGDSGGYGGTTQMTTGEKEKTERTERGSREPRVSPFFLGRLI